MIRSIKALTLAFVIVAALSGVAQPGPKRFGRVTNQLPPSWSSGTYSYDGAGNIYEVGSSVVPDGEGLRTTYTYDAMSRLARVDTMRVSGSAGTPGYEEYSYDVYGNVTHARLKDGISYDPVLDAAHNNNRLQLSGSISYDEVGNLTHYDNGDGFHYDAASMITARDHDAAQDWFIYDASDERVGAMSGGTWTWSVRGTDGNVLRQYTSSNAAPGQAWTWVEDYVYAGSKLLAADRPIEDGARRHFHIDHLGTPRLITGYYGEAVSQHDYSAFGVEMTSMRAEVSNGLDREEPMKYTSHERDLAGGTLSENKHYYDYMHARYYQTVLGRFLSPDPSPGAAISPQSWNRYTYALNNPARMIDPDGRRELEFKIRFFIPSAWVALGWGINAGDDRTFSLDPDASVRTEATIRIETDRAISLTGQIPIPGGGIRTGLSVAVRYTGGAPVTDKAEGSSISSYVRRVRGGVLISASQNEPEPAAVSFGFPHLAIGTLGVGGIRANLNIFVSEDGRRIELVGERSAFPAAEINASAGSQTFALFRGDAFRFPGGFGVFPTRTFKRECKDANGNWTCH